MESEQGRERQNIESTTNKYMLRRERSEESIMKVIIIKHGEDSGDRENH